jgi:hypothetical protein
LPKGRRGSSATCMAAPDWARRTASSARSSEKTWDTMLRSG